jgi:hypothetical protein
VNRDNIFGLNAKVEPKPNPYQHTQQVTPRQPVQTTPQSRTLPKVDETLSSHAHYHYTVSMPTPDRRFSIAITTPMRITTSTPGKQAHSQPQLTMIIATIPLFTSNCNKNMHSNSNREMARKRHPCIHTLWFLCVALASPNHHDSTTTSELV